jgi:preprotein translocase subunit SecE
MAKTALVAGETSNETQPNAIVGWSTGTYQQARTFLGDVRNEMRKVITPSRKEVQATTTVVIVTVLVFATYFFFVDYIFSNGLRLLMAKLVGS